MSNPFFSIIIPANNAENYIRPLLDSIAAQTFRDYEIIVICDSCTDGTERIAREYGARTESVSFGRDGLSRDRGIELATGDWILFADDDDWFLYDTAFRKLYDVASGTDADVIAFGFEFRTKGIIHPSDSRLFVPRIDHVWSSAWRRSSIGTARFGNAVFCSDTYFLRDMKARVRKHVLFDYPIYYYNFLRPGSQTDLFVKGIIKESPVAE